MKVQIQLPPKLIPVFTRPDMRYRSSWGGRGSGKTRTFAQMTAIKGYMYAEAGISGMILGGREFMNTLSDSSMEEIKQAIQSTPFLNDYYDVGETYIRTKNKRVYYGFCGLRHNLDSIKSKARILLCWVDEAENVSDKAWRKLLPTVRENNSEVWVTWNPENEGSATSNRFRHEQIIDDETGKVVGIGCEMNYTDNPWFPSVLDLERRMDKKNMSNEMYRHVWEGDYLEVVDGAIYEKEFEQIKLENRICKIPHDPNLPVYTSWDLGILDSTAIWFFQIYGKEIRVIDHYEANDEPLSHYARILDEKAKQFGYNYGKHFAPHDIAARDLSSGVSREQTMATLGYRMTKGARLGVEDRIEATRQMLKNCWFDAEKCKQGIRALQNYRREFNDKLDQFKATPVHDWASHSSDAFGEGALNINKMCAPTKSAPPPPPTHQSSWMS